MISDQSLLFNSIVLYTLTILFIYILVTSTPELKDLYQHITPRYAVHWKVIGTLLGL